MPIGPLAGTEYDPRTIEIDTDRVLSHVSRHYAVVDVGSNSIRLVVYDDLCRAPFPRFNEKSLVALGDGIDADGNFSDEIIARALAAMRRFKSITTAMGVDKVDVIATEAARRAGNGADFIAAITRETGWTPRLLAGEVEATLAGLGVISGFFQPRGFVGDIGGGSLEIAEVLGDRVGDGPVSMPLGALPVRALMREDVAKARKHVDSVLKGNLPPLLNDPTFYAVGGGWRALARIHIAKTNWPVGVVHGYTLPADEVAQLAKSIAQMSPDEVAQLPDVPSRRIDTLAASALVMWRLLKKLKPDNVVFSALGIREGGLYGLLTEEEQLRDPLVEGAMALGLPYARVPAFAEALGRWTEGLFPDEPQSERRLRLAACALSDMAWRDHQKVRAAESFMRLLQFPFIGLSHHERAFVATAIMTRYGGKPAKLDTSATDLLTASELRKAEFLGRALRLGYRLSASVPDILSQTRISVEGDTIVVEVGAALDAPDSDAVTDRLSQLAKVFGMDAELRQATD